MKKSLLATVMLPLLLGAATAQANFLQAESLTPLQTNSFSGALGNSSTQEAVDPFTFDFFDSALGDLTGVFISYDVVMSGGLLGADNQTNEEVTGDMELGGGVNFDAEIPFLDATYNPILNQVTGSKKTDFTLAADPTLSVGGDGPDVIEISGDTFTGGAQNIAVSEALIDNFSVAGGGQFQIDFTSFSTTLINAPGAYGYFNSPTLDLNVSLYYTYQQPEEETPSDVNAPASLALSSLMLFGLASMRRRK